MKSVKERPILTLSKNSSDDLGLDVWHLKLCQIQEKHLAPIPSNTNYVTIVYNLCARLEPIRS